MGYDGGMADTIEVTTFSFLRDLWKERNWPLPLVYNLSEEITGSELLSQLKIPAQRVEGIILNHTAMSVENAVIRPGDRVALLPPGTPGPHRLLLGIRSK